MPIDTPRRARRWRKAVVRACLAGVILVVAVVVIANVVVVARPVTG